MALKPPHKPNIEFMVLPAEIHSEIASYLDFPNLRITCRYFYNNIPPATHAQLLAAEKLPVFAAGAFYSCKDCLRLRPADKFDPNMRKGRRGRWGKRSHERFCLYCGFHPKPGISAYSRGSRFNIMGERFVICWDCSKLRRAVLDRTQKKCQRCWMQGQSSQHKLVRFEREVGFAARIDKKAFDQRIKDACGSIFEPSSGDDSEGE